MKKFSVAFNIGNSSTGEIGAVIRVFADDEEEAIANANHVLDWHSDELPIRSGCENLDYFTVFLNLGRKLTKDDIGDVQPNERTA